MHIRRLDLRFIIIILIALPTALLTQFQNHFSIRIENVEAGAVKVELQARSNKFEATFPFGQLREIRGTFQRSMAGSTVLGELSASSSSKTVDLVDAHGAYFFGNFFGTGFVGAVLDNFKRSFGDWTIDRFDSPVVNIAKIEMELPITLEAQVLGRGSTNLFLVDEQMRQIKISIDDGFIDNAVHICADATCPVGGDLNESIGLNIWRIINVFAQAVVFAGLIWILSLVLAKLSRPRFKPLPESIIGLTTVAIIIFHSISIYLFSSGILAAIAHVPDAAIYLRQAILLGHGMFAAALPPAQPYGAFLSNSAVIENGMVLYRHASHFWPLFLAPFARLGLLAAVNPLLAFLSITSLAYLVRTYWGSREACLSVLMYALSPFVFVNYGDYMMHGFCLTLILLTLACVTRFEKVRSKRWCLLAGFLAGYCFGARQITAIALGTPLFLLWVVKLRANKQLAAVRLFIMGALPCLVGFLYNNYLVTGSPWRSIYAYLHGLSLSLSNLPTGLALGDSMLGYLGSILLPSVAPSFCLGLAFFGLIAEWSRRSLALAILFASLLFMHFFLNTNGMHGYGPRFLFEASAALLVLVALGIYALLKRAPLWGGALVAIYIVFAVSRLTLDLPAYRNYNGVSQENFKTAKELPATSTILLVHGDSWQTLDTYASLFDPRWRGLLVVRALDNGAERAVIDALPQRRLVEMH